MALKILLIKPYQKTVALSVCPPLGCLFLASAIREALGDRIEVRVLDAKVYARPPEEMGDDLAWADVVGISAENLDARVSEEIARQTKALSRDKIVAIGGPYVYLRGAETMGQCEAYDWAFDGEADRTFPEALRRHLASESLEGILGLYYREGESLVEPAGTDFIEDLDQVPIAAWDLIDLDAYRDVPSQNQWEKGTRYATLFTSRGCPYKCIYCHDLFGKKFRYRSAEHVLEEMSLLIDRYGVDEFQIVDDIFNIHKPRLRKIFALLEERYPGRQFHFCFPNGLRADILDRDTVRVLRKAGTYQINLAIETVTPRLQTLIQKDLKLDRLDNAIDYCWDEGIVVKGFFMLGFPTESPRELLSTVWFALKSNLTMASFFTVVPQPETPLYDLALQEGAKGLEALKHQNYYGQGWYELSTGFPLNLVVKLSVISFYFLSPRRVHRLFRVLGIRRAGRAFYQFLSLISPVELQHLRIRKLRLGTPARPQPIPKGAP